MATRTHDPNTPVDHGHHRKIRLRTNGQGYWEVWWTDAARGYVTRRESCRTKIQSEAQAYLHEFCQAAAAQTQRVAKAQATVDELCRLWLAHAESSGKTQSGDYSLRPIRARLGRLTVDELTDDRLEQYQRDRGVADSTLRRELGALQTVLRWAGKKNRHINQNSVPEFELPDAGEPRDLFLDRQQEAWFWNQAMAWGRQRSENRRYQEAGYRVMVFIALALCTAARRTAIYELTWDRVDLERRRIDYRVPGARQNKLKRRGNLPISDRLLPVLQEAAARAPRNALGAPQGRVLGDGAKTVREAFRTFVEAIGVPWVTPHVLRHTWGTLAAQNGVPLWQIAGMMCDTIKTIDDNYLHHQPDHLRSAANHLTMNAGGQHHVAAE